MMQRPGARGRPKRYTLASTDESLRGTPWTTPRWPRSNRGRPHQQPGSSRPHSPHEATAHQHWFPHAAPPLHNDSSSHSSQNVTQPQAAGTGVNLVHYSRNPYGHTSRPPSRLGRSSPLAKFPGWNASNAHSSVLGDTYAGLSSHNQQYAHSQAFVAPVYDPPSPSGRRTPFPAQGHSVNDHFSNAFANSSTHSPAPDPLHSYARPSTPTSYGGGSGGSTLATVFANDGMYPIYPRSSGRSSPAQQFIDSDLYAPYQYESGRPGWGLSSQPLAAAGGIEQSHATHAHQQHSPQPWGPGLNTQQTQPSHIGQQAPGVTVDSQQAYCPCTVQENGNTIDLNFHNNPDSYYEFDKQTGKLYRILKKSRQKLEVKKNSEEWQKVAKASKAGAKAVGRGALAALQVAGLFADVLGAF